MTEFSFSFFFS